MKNQYLVYDHDGSHPCCDGGRTGLSEDYYVSESDFGHGDFSGIDPPVGFDCSHGFHVKNCDTLKICR